MPSDYWTASCVDRASSSCPPDDTVLGSGKSASRQTAAILLTDRAPPVIPQHQTTTLLHTSCPFILRVARCWRPVPTSFDTVSTFRANLPLPVTLPYSFDYSSVYGLRPASPSCPSDADETVGSKNSAGCCDTADRQSSASDTPATALLWPRTVTPQHLSGMWLVPCHGFLLFYSCNL